MTTQPTHEIRSRKASALAPAIQAGDAVATGGLSYGLDLGVQPQIHRKDGSEFVSGNNGIATQDRWFTRRQMMGGGTMGGDA